MKLVKGLKSVGLRDDLREKTIAVGRPPSAIVWVLFVVLYFSLSNVFVWQCHDILESALWIISDANLMLDYKRAESRKQGS